MPSKYKTALVTGGAGFIGSHIVDALIKRRIKVIVVDDLSAGDQKNLNPNAKFILLSITNPQFPNLIKRLKPDIIFHCAAQINVNCALEDPPKDAKTNILGTVALAHAAGLAGVKKIVFSSTGGAMYAERNRRPYSEKLPAEPISPYGISKRSSEMYLDFAHSEHGMQVVCLRYSNVFGPRQNNKGEAGVVAVFTDAMLKGKPVKINGKGRQTRDFVFVDDVVCANMLAMRTNVSGIFNIGTGKETDIRTLFKKLNALTGGKTEERYAPACPGEIVKSSIDSRKARRHLSWAPKVKFDDGLKKTVEWFKKNK